MRKANSSKYKKNIAGETKIFTKILKTIFIILFVNFFAFSSVFLCYILIVMNDRVEYDVRANKLQLTTLIYSADENGNFREFDKVFSGENRIWVDFNDIPQCMKDAIISIEDKRFYEHRGVDWIRTGGAILNLFRRKGDFGGSTLTQQLIKNLTDENEVSITRKIKEIFRATNFEKDFSKDEVLEAYLNIVNFGNNCRGVQAAAKLYFGKSIKDCSITQCAAIAAITQNPSANNPLTHPENNQARRDVILREMLSQNKITQDQYDKSIVESKNITFSKNVDNKNVSANKSVRSWYIECTFKDVMEDLMSKYKISKAAALDVLFNQGLKIYCAIDEKAQKSAETVILETLIPQDKNLELGYTMMGFDGRVLASVGSRAKKTGNMLFDRATSARRQPGSSIKPISIYAPAIDSGLINYASIVKDQPLPNFYGKGKPGPHNWYSGYKGNVPLVWAIQQSANAPAAQVLQALTYQKSFEFLTKKLCLKNLDVEDKTSGGALALGGLHGGVTVRDMTASFQIFGNGGIYNKPYTYYYVLDRNGNLLLDNRDKTGSKVISSQTATIMNRLLRQVVISGTGKDTNIENWEVIGKTGTTNDNKDSWFVGMTPEAVAGIWTGYDSPKRLGQPNFAKTVWKEIMIKYLSGKTPKQYKLDPNVKELPYCVSSGKLANTGACTSTSIGYFSSDNLPSSCSQHIGAKSSVGIASASKKDENRSKVNMSDLNQSIPEDLNE